MRHTQNSAAPREGCGAVFSVDPSEVLASNSRPLLALRDALHQGVIAEALTRPPRSMPPETRQMKQVTPLVRDQLAADYRAGLGIYELARKHGLHRYTVSQHLAAAGVVMRRTITDKEKAKARELFESGTTYAEISRQLKRDPATVKKMIKSQDLDPSPHG